MSLYSKKLILIEAKSEVLLEMRLGSILLYMVEHGHNIWNSQNLWDIKTAENCKGYVANLFTTTDVMNIRKCHICRVDDRHGISIS